MTSKQRRSPATSAEVYKPVDRSATTPLRSSSSATKTASTTTTKAAPGEPLQYRYQLAQWVAERRADGWYIARSWTASQGEKPRWEGPFAFPEDAAIAIARHLCTELSNRHMSKARFYQVKHGNPLYGLPPPPALHRSRNSGGRS